MAKRIKTNADARSKELEYNGNGMDVSAVQIKEILDQGQEATYDASSGEMLDEEW
jgi:hypothetical protein